MIYHQALCAHLLGPAVQVAKGVLEAILQLFEEGLAYLVAGKVVLYVKKVNSRHLAKHKLLQLGLAVLDRQLDHGLELGNVENVLIYLQDLPVQ